jgi:hypothetical protein
MLRGIDSSPRNFDCVDYGHLPIEEFSEDGGSILHNPNDNYNTCVPKPRAIYKSSDLRPRYPSEHNAITLVQPTCK